MYALNPAMKSHAKEPLAGLQWKFSQSQEDINR
jgi:hypothetical protein